MATFDFILDETNVGDVLPVANGFLVSLRQTQAGLHETPDHHPARQQFTSGYFTLRGSGDTQNLINASPQSGGVFSVGSGSIIAVNASIGYRGDLMVVGVPRSSVWALTLSDIPVVRAPAPPSINFTNANFKPRNPPAAPKASTDKPRGAKSTARKAKAVLEAARAPAE